MPRTLPLHSQGTDACELFGPGVRDAAAAMLHDVHDLGRAMLVLIQRVYSGRTVFPRV